MNAFTPDPHSDRPNEVEPQAAIARAAADWLARRDRGLTPTEQDAFFQWLASDPRHGEWLARLQATWQDFNALSEWRPEHALAPNPDLLAKPKQRTSLLRWAWLAPVAAAACIAIGFLVLSEPGHKSETVPSPSPVGATRTRALEDGSSIDLRGDSEVRVTFTAATRHIDLLRGEAFFSVAKDPQRPFVVRANGVDVRAVGTAFNVRVGPTAVEVLVTEGRVQVAPQTPAASDPQGNFRPALPHLVAAGERAVVAVVAQVAAPEVISVTGEEIARELAWQPRLLDFNATPLAEVLSEFNARNRTQVVLADPSLGTLPIIASVRSDNVEGFVRLLETTTGVRATRQGDTITLGVKP